MLVSRWEGETLATGPSLSHLPVYDDLGYGGNHHYTYLLLLILILHSKYEFQKMIIVKRRNMSRELRRRKIFYPLLMRTEANVMQNICLFFLNLQ